MRNIDRVSEDNLKLLARFIKESITVGDIINDSTYSSKMVMSSTKTQELLSSMTEDVLYFANEIISKKRILTIKKTDVAPTIDNTDIDTIYIYQNPDTNSIEQWLKFNNETLFPINTDSSESIDLSNFMTKSEAENEFVSQDIIQPLENFINSFCGSDNYNNIIEALNYFVTILSNNESSNVEVVDYIDETSSDNQIVNIGGILSYLETKTCSPILTSPNGSNYKIIVDSEGNLTGEPC